MRLRKLITEMAEKRCQNCGKEISPSAYRCPHCHERVNVPTEENKENNDNDNSALEIDNRECFGTSISSEKNINKRKRTALFILIGIVLCVGAIALYLWVSPSGGESAATATDSVATSQDTILPTPIPPDTCGLPNDSVITPEDTIGRQATRRDSATALKQTPKPPVEQGEIYYTIGDTRLTKDANTWSISSNISYGKKLIKIADGSDGYTKVKYGRLSGYVLNRFILNEDDFRLFECIFGSNEALEAIPYADFRRALFDYYKSHNMEGWQFMLHNGRSRPNEVMFKCIFPKFSEYKHKDMAIILEKIDSKERKILIFEGKDNGDIQFVFEDSTYPALYYISDVSAHKSVLQIVYSYIERDNIIAEGPTDVYDEYHGRYLRR